MIHNFESIKIKLLSKTCGITLKKIFYIIDMFSKTVFLTLNDGFEGRQKHVT